MVTSETGAAIDGANGLAARAWFQGTITAALGLTIFEALLIQKKKSFFTGGFLAGTHATNASETLGFLAASFVLDAALAGIIAAVILWLTSRVRLTNRARLAAVAIGSAAPIAAATFINYRLLAYFGDLFDLALMFDLTGRAPSEILAVGSAHLLAPVALIATGAGAIAGLVWTINRLGAPSARSAARLGWRRAGVAVLLFVVGLITTVATTAASELFDDGLRRKSSGKMFAGLGDVLTDFDGDGYGIGGPMRDPAPFDAAIFRYAAEVPGNGVDENAVGGDLPAGLPPYLEAPVASAPWTQRPDVVFVVLESFRADAVGRVVEGIPVTPTLDALAAEGVSSQRAYSHNGYTSQSRFHLFTGSLAGVRPGGSLIDDFRAQGYETAYFSAQDESFADPTLRVGFDRAETAYDARSDRARRYTTFTTPGSLAVSHVTLRERIDAFLARRDGRRPLFLYVNFHDTHFPYHHGELEPILPGRPVSRGSIAPQRRDDVLRMYYNTAANVDRALDRTLASVTRALGRQPAVIVTGDHGESLFDEGFLGHGYALNEVQTRIPLIVRGLPMEIRQPFGQSDLRDAIASALSRAFGADAAPRLIDEPGKTVFQYLGNIHRPKQIAFTGVAGPLIYDFRTDNVQLPDGTRARPAALRGDTAREFLELVHLWERMILARAALRAAATE